MITTTEIKESLAFGVGKTIISFIAFYSLGTTLFAQYILKAPFSWNFFLGSTVFNAVSFIATIAILKKIGMI